MWRRDFFQLTKTGTGSGIGFGERYLRDFRIANFSVGKDFPAIFIFKLGTALGRKTRDTHLNDFLYDNCNLLKTRKKKNWRSQNRTEKNDIFPVLYNKSILCYRQPNLV